MIDVDVKREWQGGIEFLGQFDFNETKKINGRSRLQ